MPTFDHVLVGGGLASATAVETLLQRGIAGDRIALIGAEPELPYHRPPLSKGYLLDRASKESVFVKPPSFYDAAGVRLFLGTKVTAVDAVAHTVTTDRGEVLRYGTLLIATGCTLRKLSVQGSDLPGISYLRTLADAEVIKERMMQAKTAVVIGGSFIGMELASAFAQKGLAVTVLHREPAIFDRLGSPEASAFFAQIYQDQGVSLQTEDEVTAVERMRDGRLSVQTRRGAVLPADLVAVGIGVVPNTHCLAGSGIDVDNGIVVNEYLETSAPDVYAAGDVANFFDPLYGRQRRIEHWATAIEHGKVAGANLAARERSDRVSYDAVSYFFSDIFDLSFEYFGDARDTDQTILRGAFAKRAVTILYLRDHVIRSAFTMGRPKERKSLIALIKSRQAVTDPSHLSDASRPLPSPEERT